MIAITPDSPSAADFDQLALPVSASPAIHEFLRPLAELPSLNQAFREIGGGVLPSPGDADVEAAGCRLRSDNTFEFGDPSLAGMLIQDHLIGRAGGFRYLDEHHIGWVYRVLDPKPDRSGNWQALAIGLDCCLADSCWKTIRARMVTDLRQRFAMRTPPLGNGVDRIESTHQVQVMVDALRNWDRAPLLVPLLYKGSIASAGKEFVISIEELASHYFVTARPRPITWREELTAALQTLAHSHIFRMQLSSTGWRPQQLSFVPAIPQLSFEGAKVRVRLEPDFVRFLAPCFPAITPDAAEPPPAPCPPSQPASKSVAELTITPPDPQPAASEPKQPAPRLTLTPLQQDALILRRVYPATVLSTMNKKSLGKLVSEAGHVEYLNQLLVDADNPTDPIQRMMIEQLAWAHCRIGQLHVEAALASSADVQVAFTLAACRLSSEFRKGALGLKQLRAPTRAATSSRRETAMSPKAAGQVAPDIAAAATSENVLGREPNFHSDSAGEAVSLGNDAKFSEAAPATRQTEPRATALPAAVLQRYAQVAAPRPPVAAHADLLSKAEVAN